MARKTLDTNISFDDIFNRLLFTAVALEVAAEEEDKELSGQATPLNQLIGRWEALDGDRKSQQRTTTRTNALCKRRNQQLDAALTAVHNAILAEVEQDRAAPLFTHLFPKPLSQLVKPALEGQLKITAAFGERLKNSEAPAALRKAHEKPLARGIEQGEAAQKQRLVTQAATAALTAQVDALWADANAALQHVEGTLKQVAAKRRLGRDWVDSFFPDAVSRAKSKPAPANETAVATA